jgi:hypothetical protein
MATRKIDAPFEQTPLVVKSIPTIQSPVFDENVQQNQSVKVPEPLQRKSELGKGIAYLIPGCLIFLAGGFYASSSKSAGNFDAFYQQLIIANVLICAGVVIVWDAAKIFGREIVSFVRTLRHNL